MLWYIMQCNTKYATHLLYFFLIAKQQKQKKKCFFYSKNRKTAKTKKTAKQQTRNSKIEIEHAETENRMQNVRYA